MAEEWIAHGKKMTMSEFRALLKATAGSKSLIAGEPFSSLGVKVKAASEKNHKVT